MTATIETTHTVRKSSRAEASQLGHTLARAFLDDPVTNYILPDPETRWEPLRRAFSEVYVPMIGMPHDLAYTTVDYEAVAMWLPPGEDQMGFAEGMGVAAALVRRLGRRAPAALRAAATMDKSHPKEPHYTLFFIGTDPDHQGKGYGAQVIRPILERADREGVPCFLDSSTPKNHTFYLRHGFRIVHTFELPNGGPPMWAFYREPGAPISA